MRARSKEKWYNWDSMSRKRKTKNRKKVTEKTTEPEIVIREVELGGKKPAVEESAHRGEEGAGVIGEAVVDEEISEAVAGEGVDEVVEEDAIEDEAGAEGDVENDIAREADDDEGRRHVAGDEKAGESEEKRRGGWLHRVNVYYPWLKFVVLVAIVIGVGFGAFGVGKLVGNAIWEATGGASGDEVTTDEPEEKEPGEEVQEKPTGGTDEETPVEPEEKPEEKPVEPEKPAATTNPPVTVPVTGEKKLIALTFDDGPSTATTGRLLDILKAKGVKATFFVVGSMASRAPDLLKREEAEGHEVGSHSSYHQDLSKLSAVDLQGDVANMDQIFMNTLGRKVAIIRPPYGAVSDIMRGYLGKPMIYWSVDPQDWKYRNAATVRANVVGAAHDGAIVLMHDIHASTVDAVANIIDDLRAQGYEFLTVSELAAARGVGLTSGVVYYNFRP